ncbi:hypothetical protein KIPB_008011, partial [Kipferlia bialata]
EAEDRQKESNEDRQREEEKHIRLGCVLTWYEYPSMLPIRGISVPGLILSSAVSSAADTVGFLTDEAIYVWGTSKALVRVEMAKLYPRTILYIPTVQTSSVKGSLETLADTLCCSFSRDGREGLWVVDETK